MDRKFARKAIDKKLSQLPPLSQMQRPHKGWIRAIRESLGMPLTQLAQRMGVSQPWVSAMEKKEMDDTLTIASLRKAAKALDCALVYHFIPKKSSLDKAVMDRARQIARQRISKVDHTMALEAQNLDTSMLENEVEELAMKLVNEQISLLWEETP